MNYAELKRNYDLARKEQLTVDKEISRIESEISNVKDAYKGIDSKFTKLQEKDRIDALERYRVSCCEEMSNTLAKNKDILVRLQAEYDSKCSQVTYENLLSKCSNRQDILEEVREANAILEEHLRDLVGDRFYCALTDSLQAQEISLEEDNLDSLIQYFNESEAVIGEFAVGEKANTFLSEIESVLMASESESGQNLTGAISIGVVVVILFFKQWALPVCLLLCASVAIYEIVKYYKVYSILIIQKAVKDNIDKIDTHLKKQIEEEVQRQRNELDDLYLDKINVTKAKIEALERELQQTMITVENSFVYDGKILAGEKQAEVERLDKQKSALLVQVQQQKDLLIQKTKIVENLGNQLGEMLRDLRKAYFDGIGKELIFEPTFLFDVDSLKNKPIFFKHPQASVLILYDSIEDAIDFMRLISYELRAKLNPFVLNITAMDLQYAGQQMIYFRPSDSDGLNTSSMFKLVTNKPELDKWKKDLELDFKRRMDNIQREFSGIDEYNKKMMEIQSLTESYDFEFVLGPDSSFFTDDVIARVLRVGSSLGMYMHLLISKDEFVKMKSDVLELLDDVGKVYYLEAGNILERAKDFIIDNLIPEDDD